MQSLADCPASSMSSQPLNIFSCFRRGDGLGAHCKEGADKQNAGAPKLGVRESFAIEPGRQCHCNGWAKQLETLRERDSDFLDRYVIQNVGECNTGYCRDDQNQVRLRVGVKWSSDFAEGEGERKQHCRSNETDEAEAADRSKLS